MKKKEQIYYLLNEFKEKKCDTKSFCDQLGVLYFFENSGRAEFDNGERTLLDELVGFTERYSDLIEDNNEEFYYNENQVIEKFCEIYYKLLDKQN